MSRLAFLVVIAGLVVLVASLTDWSGPLKPEVSLPLLTNFLLVCLTAWYVHLTHALLKSQTEPCVVVSVMRQGMLAYIVMNNIGKGLARDIRFESSEKMMVVPAALACTTSAALTEMNEGPLIQGIPALGPGEKRVLLWGPLNVLAGWIGNRTITVKCTFSDNGQSAKPIHCPLELHSLCFTGEEYTDLGRDLNDIIAEAVRRHSPFGP